MKVTFRAIFAGPIGKLNPSQWHAPNPPAVEVEVFESKNTYGDVTWKARSVATGVEFKGISHETHVGAKAAIAECFSVQRSPSWTAYAWTKTIESDENGKRRKWDDPAPISEDAIEEQPNGKFKRKLFTHIANPQQSEGGNYFMSICGERVHAIQIRSRRAHVEPTCKKCLIEWKKEKRQPRI